MSRGGSRVGAGRPKSSGNEDKIKPIAADVKVAANKSRMSPLDYMMAVMNDGSADAARRDRMAVAAAPYVHGKAEAVTGKKELADIAAQTAEQGTAWGALLN